MKFHHAALLTVLVWYLVLPAVAERSGAREQTVLLLGTYDTRAQCEQERRSLTRDPSLADKVKAVKCVSSSKTGSQAKTGSRTKDSQ